MDPENGGPSENDLVKATKEVGNFKPHRSGWEGKVLVKRGEVGKNVHSLMNTKPKITEQINKAPGVKVEEQPTQKPKFNEFGEIE